MITKESANSFIEDNQLDIKDEITIVLDNGDSFKSQLYKTNHHYRTRYDKCKQIIQSTGITSHRNKKPFHLERLSKVYISRLFLQLVEFRPAS